MNQIGLVVVPYITSDAHLKLAKSALNSFRSIHPLFKVAVANKWTKEAQRALEAEFDLCLINDENNLSKAWNEGIQRCFDEGCEYVIVPNLDVICGKKCIDFLVEFAHANPELLIWTATEHEASQIDVDCGCDSVERSPHFGMFMVDKRLFEEVGKFDEGIEIYHGDNDIVRRVLLSKGKVGRTNRARFWHYGSATIKLSDRPDIAEGELGSGESHDIYIKKHGGPPGEEIFIHPYNDPAQSWKIQ